MFKLTVLFSTLTALGSLWAGGGRLPRATGTDLDYLLMPLLGYLGIIVIAQVAAHLSGSATDASG